VLAGLIAPFVTDREREVHILGMGLEEMGDAFDGLVAQTHELVRTMEAWGFVTPFLQFWPAAVLYLWAKGISWGELKRAVAQDEGDLVSLIVRTADHLRQVCDLADTHPRLAGTARLALRRIEREPAIYL
jgi:superfamily II RNA helicase